MSQLNGILLMNEIKLKLVILISRLDSQVGLASVKVVKYQSLPSDKPSWEVGD